MIWRDLVLSCHPGVEKLVSTLAEVFNLEENAIHVTIALEDAKSDVSVICVRSELSGQFCLLLSFYVSFSIDDEIAILTAICEKLSCQILISNDDTLNPYSMLLINPEGILYEVKINPDKLEQQEEYEVVLAYQVQISDKTFARIVAIPN
jgi:hypothetical protein